MALSEWNAYARLALDVVAAEGCELVLRGGRRVLDLYGGHCVNTLGAGDERLGAVITEQWRRLSFATNLLDHGARHDFLEAFEANLPPGDWSVFCSNSGAEANENALKAALAASGRSVVVTFGGAFHGRTAAAAAVSGGQGDVRAARFPAAAVPAAPFPAPPFTVRRVPFGDAPAARRAIDDAVGAVILEPIQSLAGVVDPPEGFLAALREACDGAGALLIFDEVQTGNGRLGTPFAAQYFGVVPDLFTTAKGVAGGLPMGLTVAARRVELRTPGGLFGSTFGGGPLVLAAAAHVARRIAEPGFLANVGRTSAALREAALRGPVRRVRGAGLLLGLELAPGVRAAALRDALLEHDVLIGTSDDPQVARLSPSLALTPGAAERLALALDRAADRIGDPA